MRSVIWYAPGKKKGRQLGELASQWPMIYTVAAGPLRPLGYKEGIVTLMEFTPDARLRD